MLENYGAETEDVASCVSQRTSSEGGELSKESKERRTHAQLNFSLTADIRNQRALIMHVRRRRPDNESGN